MRAGALAACTLLAYAASLGGGFLNYDDPWLIGRNPWLEASPLEALHAILFDFSRATRRQLGAEYLPLRDLSVWLDVQLWGPNPQAMRATQLALYIGAALAFRGAFGATFGASRGELLAWLFALHPVHVESVAWLAGRKDVLGLLFMGLCLWRHALDRRDARFSVPALWVAACLSKSMALGLVGPLLATDLWLRRRPDPVRYGMSAVGVGLVTALHVHVGSLVHMVSGPLAGAPTTAVWTMGTVWLRYLAMLVDPRQMSVRHDVALLDSPTALSLLGWTLLIGGGAAAVWLAVRRDRRLPLTAWLWFVVPLGPVSQVLVPLQNLMADRYLWLSVAGPALLLAHLDLCLSPRLAKALVLALLVPLAGTTALRARVFADSVRLFVEAARKTQRDPVAPYQLGKALEQRGEYADATVAFGEALARAAPDDPMLPRAANNLAKLLVKKGELARARGVLEYALTHQPKHAKLRRNHAKVLAKLRVRKSPQGGAQPRTGTDE